MPEVQSETLTTTPVTAEQTPLNASETTVPGTQTSKNEEVFAIIALVAGIIGIPGICVGCCGFPIQAFGLVFGYLAIQKPNKNRSLAIAALVLCGLELFLTFGIGAIAILTQSSLGFLNGINLPR